MTPSVDESAAEDEVDKESFAAKTMNLDPTFDPDSRLLVKKKLAERIGSKLKD